MVITKYYTTEDILDKLKELKGKRKLKFYQKISNYYDAMGFGRRSNTFQSKEDPFSRNAEGLANFIMGCFHY